MILISTLLFLMGIVATISLVVGILRVSAIRQGREEENEERVRLAGRLFSKWRAANPGACVKCSHEGRRLLMEYVAAEKVRCKHPPCESTAVTELEKRAKACTCGGSDDPEPEPEELFLHEAKRAA